MRTVFLLQSTIAGKTLIYFERHKAVVSKQDKEERKLLLLLSVLIVLMDVAVYRMIRWMGR
jgi:hypothetical protein